MKPSALCNALAAHVKRLYPKGYCSLYIVGDSAPAELVELSKKKSIGTERSDAFCLSLLLLCLC